MIKNPVITVGIPVYNGGVYLEVAIKSVLNQSFTDFELIIINDGSIDNSQDIIDSFSDSRIKVIADGTNKGLIHRLNEMIRMANGKYFVRMDADDIMFPNRLEVQYNFLEDNPAIILCHSSAISIDKDNNVLGIRNSVNVNNEQDVLNGKMPIHPTVAARVEFFLQNPYHSGFFQMEDKELWYRTVNLFKFGKIKEPLLFYREDSSPNSIKHKKMYRGLEKFIETHISESKVANKILQDSKKKYITYKAFETLRIENILLKRRYTKVHVNQYNEMLEQIIRYN